MSIEQRKVVDFISVNPRGEVVLTISDHLKWGEGENHLYLLQEKVNDYIAYIFSDQILEVYPDSNGRVPMISLKCLYAPNEEGMALLRSISEVLGNNKIGFEVEHTPVTALQA